MPHRVLNIEDASEYLHLPLDRMQDLIRYNEIPHERKGQRVRFVRKDIDAWASRHIITLEPEHLATYHRTSSAKVHDLSARHAIIPELMKVSFIDAALEAKTRASVLRSMIRQAAQTDKLIYDDDLKDMVEEREKMASTALNGGIAMMHPTHHDPYMFEDSFIVFSRACQQVPFGAPDGKTTDLFFLICCQDDRIHLHALARLCMMSRQTDLHEKLRQAADSAEIYEAIVTAEEQVIKAL